MTTLPATTTDKKAKALDSQGMKVGAEYEGVDKHDLAASKQPQYG